MPDTGPGVGLRPVVRRVSNSGAHKDLLGRFEKNDSSSSSSGSSLTTAPRKTASSLLNRGSRVGSIKSKTSRDTALESKVLDWITSVIHEEPTASYEQFIQDGSVLAKVMTSIVFNSVPLEDISQTWGANPAHDRVKAVIREIKRYGVVDVFDAEDLLALKNVGKVTKCLLQLSKLAASDKDSLLSCAN